MNMPDAKERKAKYKASLNLPNTPFPMRANLAENEKLSRQRWDGQNLFARLMEKRSGAPAFVFHDGPPFANGEIHVGHVLNKVLKDLVVRTRNMNGERCHYVPGWDCHGLPIEHKVMTELLESGRMKELDQLEPAARWREIRQACQAYAERFKALQADQMQRLMTLADYEHPYLTMAPLYEASVLEVFAALTEQGLVYRDLKPVHWSIANQTALAEAELEYQERKDPSVYVGFEADDPAALAAVFGHAAEVAAGGASFLIWTTTPWTLPANVLIAVHADHEYSLARLGGKLYVVASELMAKVAAVENAEAHELARVRGAELVGLTYRHPFVDQEGRVVAGEHVTLEDGTGLVHTAPGHGVEDFGLGLREGLPVYSPVRGDGRYDDTVPEWLRGDLVWAANPKIVAHLRESGHLYHHHEFSHSYPHDWRSKTPVIFRCTEQWFIAVDKPTLRDGKSLRQMALDASENEIDFVPGWGKNRLRGMLESRPDWCISRQRSWGLPIPAFRRADGQVLLTPASVRAVAEVFGEKGSDAWFSLTPAELLAGYDPAADHELQDGASLDKDRLEKMFDIFDVWLESGSSWNAVMRRRGIGFPTDLYLEGSDQHRGFFQLSLLPSLGATGQAPFRTLLTHGFMVDKDGKKMSKSGGNALNVETLLKNYGADVLRWWVSSLAFENDIKVDLSFFDAAGEAYRKVRNTLRFLLSNLYDFDESQAVQQFSPTSLDAWALGRAAQLREKVLEAYFSYQFRTANLLLFDFCNDDLSAIYLDAVKDRLYCDRPDSARRRSTQTALRQIADLLIHLLAPILPHTADEAHRALRGEEAESVHLGRYPELVPPQIDRHWDAVLALRAAARKALEEAKSSGIENPLDSGLVLPDPEGVIAAYRSELPEIFGVSRVHLVPEGEIQVRDLRAEPRCERSWKRDETVRLRSDGGYLTDRDADAVGMS